MKEHVLVVDDAQAIRNFLTEYILKPRGFEVTTATNGLEGLALAVSKKPHLMILDIQMPRLTGLELLQRLRTRGIEIPTILMTAHGSEEIAVAAFRLGIRDYVIKPFDVDEMDAAIDRALREDRLRRERNELMHQLMESNIQIKKRLQELNVLYGIGRSVSSSLELTEIFNRVVEAGVYITGADEGSLLLFDHNDSSLYIQASKNMGDLKDQSVANIPDSPISQVIKTQQPVIAGIETRWSNLGDNFVAYSHAYVPLISQGKTFGILGVANRHKALKFDNRDTRLLSTLADYAVMAVVNSELQQQRGKQTVKELMPLLEKGADPILVLNEYNEIVFINESAQTVFNLTDVALVGQRIVDVLTQQKLLDFVSQHAGKNFYDHLEYTANDGRIFDAHLTLIENKGRLLILHDISKLKEIDSLKSEFMAIVSHDIRSPLTSILGYTDLIPRVGTLNETQQEYLGHINNKVKYVTSLISELLDLGKAEAGLDFSMTHCDISELLQELVSDFQFKSQSRKQKLIWKIPDLPKVMGNRNRLYQALTNLIDNAIKYTPEGGHVGIKAELQNDQIVIEVTDTGLGISPEDQEHIFDRFFRAKLVPEGIEGLGLGLSIVHSVVTQHNGRIWVTSHLGKGSTFTIVLPTALQSKKN